jgi:uncharacterized repeat protein (TIGR02543 family)
VSYYLNDGTGATYSAVIAANTDGVYGGTVSAPSIDPERTGYTFGGWYKEAAVTNPWSFADTLTEANGVTGADGNTPALALYAKWTANTYTLSFDENGGIAGSAADKTVTYGAVVGTLPTSGAGTAPTRTGYTFSGWATTNTAITADVTASTNVNWTGAKIVYAVWNEIDDYKVSYVLNGGTVSTANPAAVTYGGIVALPAIAKTGYTLIGWEKTDPAPTAAAITGQKYYEYVTADTVKAITLAAIFEAKNVTVTYNLNDGTGTTYNAVTSANTNGVYDGTVTAPADPTRARYTFGGWYKDAVCTNAWNFTATLTAANGVTGATGNNPALQLYAKWKINTFTVSFRNWDGAVLSTQTINYGSSATAPANPTRTGYTFTGWDKAFTNITSNLTVTAQFTVTPVNDEPPVDTEPPIDDEDTSGSAIEDTGNGGEEKDATEVLTPEDEPEAGDEPGSRAAVRAAERTATAEAAREQGIPVANIGGIEVPLVAPKGFDTWSLADLLLVLAMILLAVFKLVGWIRRRNQGDAADGNEIAARQEFGFIAVVAALAVAGASMFALTQDMSKPMVIFDVQSAIFAAILIVQCVFARLASKKALAAKRIGESA